MDYFGILKKAWDITWKYKVLWVLGLFAGSTSGLSSSVRDILQKQSDRMGQQGGSALGDWIGQSPVFFIAIALVLGLVGLALWVISVAAQGGLVRGADDAARGRTPVLQEEWRAGFGKWGRLFMLGLVLGLPVAIVVGVMVAIFVALGVGGLAGGDQAAGAAIIGGVCLVLPLFVIVIIALSFVIGIVYQLALRYAMLQDVTFGAAIKRGWNDLWGKRGAVMFWLVMLLPGIAFGVVASVIAVPFAVPMTVLTAGGRDIMAAGVAVLMGLVMLVPTAIYGTFVSSAWTLFFREMTGMEPAAATVPAPGYAPAAPPYAPPAPPAAEPVAPPFTEPPVVEILAPAPEAPADAPPAEEAPPADV